MNFCQSNRRTIMDDPFIRNYIEDLLKNIRTQVLLKLIKPYTRIRIPFISQVDIHSIACPCYSLLTKFGMRVSYFFWSIISSGQSVLVLHQTNTRNLLWQQELHEWLDHGTLAYAYAILGDYKTQNTNLIISLILCIKTRPFQFNSSISICLYLI